MSEIIQNITVMTIPLLFAITLHEAAHGWAAWKLGDNTAKMLGRVSFNPLVHIDPFGTVLLPALLIFSGSGFLFGYAKPVPVNFGALNNPRRDMVLVALAGPGANIILIIGAALLMNFLNLVPSVAQEWVGLNLYYMVFINAILVVFNMLPVPPLDGGRVAVGILPAFLSRPLSRLEPYGMLIIIAIVFIIPVGGRYLGLNLSVFQYIIGPPVNALMSFADQLTRLF